MDNIVSIRKKIIKKETEEEFYLNSCDVFIAGKIYEMASNSKVFYYLPYNEVFVVLFNDFISIFDLKKSIFKKLTITKQFKISEIYKFFFGESKKINKSSDNYPFTENLEIEEKEICGNSTGKINNKDNKGKNNEILFEKNLTDYNLNFKTEDQKKELKFFFVSENSYDKNLVFYIEFLNKEMIVFKINDINTDIFNKPKIQINSNLQEENKEKIKIENIKTIIVEDINENNIIPKNKINQNNKYDFLNKKKKKSNKKTKKKSKAKNSDCSSYEESNDSNYNLSKESINTESLEESEHEKKLKITNSSNRRKSNKINPEVKTNKYFQENNFILKEQDKTEKNNLKNLNSSSKIKENSIKEINLNFISDQLLKNEDVKIYMKLDHRNYINTQDYSVNYFSENLDNKEFTFNNDSLNLSQKVIKNLKNTKLNNKEKNNNDSNIFFLDNGISNYDFNGNMRILEFYVNISNLNEQKQTKNLNFVFVSNFNYLFYSIIDTSDNKVIKLSNLNNNFSEESKNSSFKIFSKYDFKILDYKLIKFEIKQNNFFIFFILIDENNDILIEAYLILINKIEKNYKNEKFLLFKKEINFSNENDFSIFNEVNNIQKIYEPSVISEINIIQEENKENFFLFITKLNKIIIYKIFLNEKNFTEKISNISTENFKLKFKNQTIENISNNDFHNTNNNFDTIKILENIDLVGIINFQGFADLQNQIKNSFVINNFLYCFDIKGNYSFYFLKDLLENPINYSKNIKNNLRYPIPTINVMQVKGLSLTREIYEIIPFITQRGFFILSSYSILKNQDFNLLYFLPKNLQVNFDAKKFSKNPEKLNFFTNNNTLISEYILRKLRIPNEIFDYVNNIINNELKSNDSTGNLLKYRVDYYLNRLKFKNDWVDDYKIRKIIKIILEKFKIFLNLEEKNLSEFSDKKENFKTICEICYDKDLDYNQDEYGYICKNDHYVPCCCLTRIPLVKFSEEKITQNKFYVCNFCDLFYDSEQIDNIGIFKSCIVCMNKINKL